MVLLDDNLFICQEILMYRVDIDVNGLLSGLLYGSYLLLHRFSIIDKFNICFTDIVKVEFILK